MPNKVDYQKSLSRIDFGTDLVSGRGTNGAVEAESGGQLEVLGSMDRGDGRDDGYFGDVDTEVDTTQSTTSGDGEAQLSAACHQSLPQMYLRPVTTSQASRVAAPRARVPEPDSRGQRQDGEDSRVPDVLPGDRLDQPVQQESQDTVAPSEDELEIANGDVLEITPADVTTSDELSDASMQDVNEVNTESRDHTQNSREGNSGRETALPVNQSRAFWFLQQEESPFPSAVSLSHSSHLRRKVARPLFDPGPSEPERESRASPLATRLSPMHSCLSPRWRQQSPPSWAKNRKRKRQSSDVGWSLEGQSDDVTRSHLFLASFATLLERTESERLLFLPVVTPLYKALSPLSPPGSGSGSLRLLSDPDSPPSAGTPRRFVSFDFAPSSHLSVPSLPCSPLAAAYQNTFKNEEIYRTLSHEVEPVRKKMRFSSQEDTSVGPSSPFQIPVTSASESAGPQPMQIDPEEGDDDKEAVTQEVEKREVSERKPQVLEREETAAARNVKQDPEQGNARDASAAQTVHLDHAYAQRHNTDTRQRDPYMPVCEDISPPTHNRIKQETSVDETTTTNPHRSNTVFPASSDHQNNLPHDRAERRIPGLASELASATSAQTNATTMNQNQVSHVPSAEGGRKLTHRPSTTLTTSQRDAYIPVCEDISPPSPRSSRRSKKGSAKRKAFKPTRRFMCFDTIRDVLVDHRSVSSIERVSWVAPQPSDLRGKLVPELYVCTSDPG